MFNGKLTVVMPAYNESDRIVYNVIETVRTLSELHYDFEIIVVDDGSSDGTHLEAATLVSEHHDQVRVIRYDVNEGKGNALMFGARHARGDYVAFLDADMDLHPEQLPLFFEIMMAKNVDVVIGSKRHPLSNVDYPPMRRLYSAVYFALVRLMFGLNVRDTQTGLKLFKTKVLSDVCPRLLVKRFAFDLELLVVAHHLGYTIAESPVTIKFQRLTSRIKFSHIQTIFTDTLAIFARLNITRYYDRKIERAPNELPAPIFVTAKDAEKERELIGRR